MEIHGTVYYESQRPPEVPAFVKNHGLLPQPEFQQLLRKAKVSPAPRRPHPLGPGAALGQDLLLELLKAWQAEGMPWLEFHGLTASGSSAPYSWSSSGYNGH